MPQDEISRLRILPLSPKGTPAGAPWAIRTPRDRSVGEVAWSPNGKRLAITMDVDPPRFLVGSEPVGDDAPMARRITRIDWRWDEEGFVDRWSHLHVVDAQRGAQPRQVTRGDWGVSKLAWSPDGKSVAFVADPRPESDVRPIDAIWTVAVDAKGAKAAPRSVLRVGGPATKPAWSPDGRWLAAHAYVAADAVDDTSPELVVGPADGSAPAWPLAPALDRPLGTWCDTDLHGWVADSRTTPVWVDAGTIVAVVTDRGRAVPWRFPVDPATGRPTGDPSPLTTLDMTTYSLAATSDAGVPVGTGGSASSAASAIARWSS